MGQGRGLQQCKDGGMMLFEGRGPVCLGGWEGVTEWHEGGGCSSARIILIYLPLDSGLLTPTCKPVGKSGDDGGSVVGGKGGMLPRGAREREQVHDDNR
jgi:hypothetical protein